MEPVKVSLGITDHAYTEVNAVLKGELKEADDVIIRSVVPKGQAPGTYGAKTAVPNRVIHGIDTRCQPTRSHAEPPLRQARLFA